MSIKMSAHSDMKNMKKRGFSLIELLVVMVLIGIFSAVVFPNLMSYRARGADNVRRSDLKSLQLALEKYYAINKKYPSTCNSGGTSSNPGTAFCSSGTFNSTNIRWFYGTPPLASFSNGGNWIPGLVASGLVKSLPRDPRENKFPGVTDATCTSATRVTYRYRSTGVHYKLQAFCGVEGANVVSGDDMYNPSAASNQATMRSLILTDVPLPLGQSCSTVAGAQWFDVPACW